MTVDTTDLSALADSLQVVKAGPQVVAPGEPAKVKIVPAASELLVTDVFDAALSALWLGKGVLFADKFLLKDAQGDALDLSVGDLEGAPNVLAKLPVLGLQVGQAIPAGVPGLVGQLSGALRLPVPVTLTVTWRVLDENGAPLTDGFVASDGLELPEASFVFFPPVVELADPPATVKRSIVASASLTAGGVTAGPFELSPAADFDVVGIPVPTVVAIFRHADFATTGGFPRVPGYVLLVVPQGSPLESFDAVKLALIAVKDLVAALPPSLPLPPVLARVADLLERMLVQPRFGFVSADGDNEVKALEQVLLDGTGIHLNAAENTSSLMVVGGTPDAKVQCFIRQNCDTKHGNFTLSLDPALFVVVRSLHSDTPATEPANVIAVQEPTVGGFGDRLSSIKFS